MKVIKLLAFSILYLIAIFVTATLFTVKEVEDTTRIISTVMLVCTIIFVVATEIYHKNKDSLKPLVTLFLIFIFNMLFMSTVSSEITLVSVSSIMFAILYARYIFNTKEEYLGCYNLWLFSAFTILLYFILIFNGSIVILLVALATLLNVAKLKHSNDEEYQKVSYIQNMVGIILITFIMLFL